jgi:hypothetical protein
MMGCFAINLFLFLMVFQAWGGGQVPDHLPFLVLGSLVLCLIGYWSNAPVEGEDDDE